MDTMVAPSIDVAADKAGPNANFFQNVAPPWGNYLYQNVLPNIPTDWLMNANLSSTTPNSATSAPNSASSQTSNPMFTDNMSWTNSASIPPTSATQIPVMNGTEPNSYYMNYYSGSIAPSLLAPSASSNGSTGTPSNVHFSPSIDVVDKIVASPSPLASVGGSPPTFYTGRFKLQSYGQRTSFDQNDIDARSQHSQHSDDHGSPEHEHDEGVERDGMIWGMKVEEYRALSARERKRVRNRISARTFRAKRKEHLSSLESTLGAKDLEIKLAHEENIRLRRELGELKRRLSAYEQKPY